jgi:hypothetical protein
MLSRGFSGLILVAKSFFFPPSPSPLPPLGEKGIRGKNFWQTLYSPGEGAARLVAASYNVYPFLYTLTLAEWFF